MMKAEKMVQLMADLMVVLKAVMKVVKMDVMTAEQ